MKPSKPYSAWNLSDWRSYYQALGFSAVQSQRAARKALSRLSRRIALASDSLEGGAR
jgi:hypothetical protein